mgnify:CR=1 FL=1
MHIYFRITIHLPISHSYEIREAFLKENQYCSQDQKYFLEDYNKNPDLSGGIKFVKSARHEGYVDATSIKKEFLKLIKNMGWAEKSAA